jgi:hypothetical protein
MRRICSIMVAIFAVAAAIPLAAAPQHRAKQDNDRYWMVSADNPKHVPKRTKNPMSFEQALSLLRNQTRGAFYDPATLRKEYWLERQRTILGFIKLREKIRYAPSTATSNR